MKTSVKIAIVVVAAGAVGTVAYKLANRLPSPDQTAEMQVQQILDDGGCLRCHSENPDLPFYASWPVAGNIVRSDVEKGYRQADLGAAFAALAEGRPVDEVSLAKMEKAISDGSMPVAKYYLVHWGSSITDAKKAKLLQWIHDHRVANYSNPATAPRFAGEPVQPLPDSLPTDARKAALGEMLYNDPRLSSDNTVSCASCHGLHTGGVDNRRYSEGVNGSLGGVNAPTVFNAALNFEQFWDGRAHTLADQAGGPPLNPVEMASTSWEQIIGKLKADPKFTAMFLKVYPGGYSGEAITEAIGEYEKTLITPDSRFDLYLKGDSTAITAQEQHGYELFKENRCATCHVGPLLGGQSFEYMGLAQDYFAARGEEMTEEDNGRFKQTQKAYDRHRFKVPGLRNVALTFPYYHDGTRETLSEAVDDMARFQVGRQLSAQDRDDIVAFLGTLTGKFRGRELTNPNAGTVAGVVRSENQQQ